MIYVFELIYIFTYFSLVIRLKYCFHHLKLLLLNPSYKEPATWMSFKVCDFNTFKTTCVTLVIQVVTLDALPVATLPNFALN